MYRFVYGKSFTYYPFLHVERSSSSSSATGSGMRGTGPVRRTAVNTRRQRAHRPRSQHHGPELSL